MNNDQRGEGGPTGGRRPVHSFRDLDVWQRGVRLAGDIVRLVRGFPDLEQYGLSSQMRRAAVSVPSNIAEGWGRGSRKELLRYVAIARGSLLELQTQLLIAEDVGYASAEQARPLLGEMDELSRMLLALTRSLSQRKD